MTTTATTTDTTTTATTSTAASGIMYGNLAIGLDSLPTYDGTTPVEDFITVVEGTSTLANWSENQMVAIALLKLRSQAKQFIDSEPTLRDTKSWVTLKDSLRSQFKKQYVQGLAIKNFIECRQRAGESCRQFLTRLKLLGNRTITLTEDILHDAHVKRKLEEDVTTQFLLGLVMPIKQRVLSSDPKSLEEALTTAVREETIENLIHPTSNKECRMIKNTREFKNYVDERKAAFPSRNKNLKCTRCEKVGHTAEYCWRKKTRTGYVCKEPGRVRTVCPKRNGTRQRIAMDKRCYKCQELGHLARTCVRKRKQSQQQALNCRAVEFQPRNLAAEQAN